MSIYSALEVSVTNQNNVLVSHILKVKTIFAKLEYSSQQFVQIFQLIKINNIFYIVYVNKFSAYNDIYADYS